MSEAQCKNSAHKAFLDKYSQTMCYHSTVDGAMPRALAHQEQTRSYGTHRREDRKYGNKILDISYHLRTSKNGNSYSMEHAPDKDRSLPSGQRHQTSLCVFLGICEILINK